MRLTMRLLVMGLLPGVFIASGLFCSKKTVEPEPVEYMLYAGVVAESGRWIFAIDAETDSVIDSVEYESDPIWVAASPDGKYLAAWSGEPCLRIYNPHDLSVLGELECHLQPAFVPGAGLIIGSNLSGTKYFDYNTFELLDEDTLRFHEPQVLADRDLLYGLIIYAEGHKDSTGFISYDCRRREVLRSWRQLPRRDGGNYRTVFDFDVHPDGGRVYGTAGITSAEGVPLGDPVFFCYDLDGDSVVFENPIYSPYGDVRVSPDGREVYLTDPGFPGSWLPTPGKVFIYDAYSGMLSGEISLEGLDTTKINPMPLHAYSLRFHPEKPKAYVGCGDMFKGGVGPIVIIDTEKREVKKLVFPDLRHCAQFIDIGPKPGRRK